MANLRLVVPPEDDYRRWEDCHRGLGWFISDRDESLNRAPRQPIHVINVIVVQERPDPEPEWRPPSCVA